MTTFAPVRQAQRMWEQTAPQLTLDIDGLSEPTGTMPLLRDIPLNRSGDCGDQGSSANPVGSENPADPTTNGSGRNPALGSAAGASQE